MAKRKTVVDLVTVLAETFGSRTSDAMFEGYYRGLADLTDEQVLAAGTAILRQSREFMPKPGQLREIALGNGRSVQAQCDAAWLVLCNAITRHGGFKSVNFRDGLINATVRIRGGWARCCSLPTEEFDKWYRREFNETYAQLLSNGCSAELAKYLPGTGEHENRGWVGKPYGNGDKVFQLPAPEQVGCDYEPALLSAPVEREAIGSSGLPRLELKQAGPFVPTRR